mgnify:CR=1 FL=1
MSAKWGHLLSHPNMAWSIWTPKWGSYGGILNYYLGFTNNPTIVFCSQESYYYS